MGSWVIFSNIFKTILYIADVGSDAYNTYGFYTDCHYHLFATSLVLLFLPNLVAFTGGMVDLIRFYFVSAGCAVCNVQ